MNEIQKNIFSCKGLVKNFNQGLVAIQVLKGLDLEVNKGQSIAIIGSSGSGKSTLLHLLGGLDRPTDGEVYLSGIQLNSLNEAHRGALRNRVLGFVYQFHHLLGEFTAE